MILGILAGALFVGWVGHRLGYYSGHYAAETQARAQWRCWKCLQSWALVHAPKGGWICTLCDEPNQACCSGCHEALVEKEGALCARCKNYVLHGPSLLGHAAYERMAEDLKARWDQHIVDTFLRGHHANSNAQEK